MKNSEIHNGLISKEIRDFLAISMCKNWEKETNNKKIVIPYNNKDIMQWSVDDCLADVEFHQRRLELLREKHALVTLIKINGWQEFDVSDDTEKDLPFRLHLNFIGTHEEYRELKKNFK